MRAIAPPGDGPLVRGAELAQGLPKLAKLFKVQIAALCEVAQMLIDRLGLPSTVGPLFNYASERWDGKGQPGHRSATRSRCPCASFTSPGMPRSSTCSAVRSSQRVYFASARDTHSIPQ